MSKLGSEEMAGFYSYVSNKRISTFYLIIDFHFFPNPREKKKFEILLKKTKVVKSEIYTYTVYLSAKHPLDKFP